MDSRTFWRALRKKIGFPPKKKREAAVFDVAHKVLRREVVLKARALHIELSVRSARRLLVRFTESRRAITAFAVLCLTAAFFGYLYVGRASTADFYPTTCLGDWTGVANALGKPDLEAGAPEEAFNGINSAVAKPGGGKIFCGNFSSGVDISNYAADTLEGAKVTFSWLVVFAGDPGSARSAATSSVASSSVAGSTAAAPEVLGTSTSRISSSSAKSNASGTEAITPAISSSSDANVSGTDAAAAGPAFAGTSTDTLVSATSSADAPLPSAPGSSTASSQTDSTGTPPTSTPTPSPAPAPATAVAPASTSTDSPPPSSSSTPAPEPASPPSVSDPSPDPAANPPPPAPAPDAAPTSFLRFFLNDAFAADVTGTVSAISSDTSSAASASGTVPASIVPVSSGTIELPAQTSTFVLPGKLVSSSLPEVAPPTVVASDTILLVSYSTDTVNWYYLGSATPGDWANAAFDVPLHSWDELKKLQIAVKMADVSGNVESVYLDGMMLAVSYGGSRAPTDAPPDAMSTAASSSTETMITSGTEIAASMTVVGRMLSPEPDHEKTYDYRAKQSCSVEPYAPIVFRGNVVHAEVSLDPAGAADPLYDVGLGEAPAGIEGTLTKITPSTYDIALKVAADARQGSFNLVVVYRERQADGEVLPNFCQYNLVVK